MLTHIKPLDDFLSLNTFLSQHGKRFVYDKKKKTICSGKEFNELVFVIKTGAVSLHRDENILIGIAKAPVIIGLSGCALRNKVNYSLMTAGPCTGYYLSSSLASAILDENSLWRAAFHWLAWQNSVLESRDCLLASSNSYEKIRATLLSMNEWDESLRMQIGVMNYIHQKTQVSRSVVAEILSALRKGGYIVMDHGKLIDIIRLPAVY